jgi:hypothetical protein
MQIETDRETGRPDGRPPCLSVASLRRGYFPSAEVSCDVTLLRGFDPEFNCEGK